MSADPDVPLASEALLRPVRPGNAFEDTVGRLLQTIRLGVLQPGESLPPERELAARLGVSRDTVREAIKSLSEAGYLVSRRGPLRRHIPGRGVTRPYRRALPASRAPRSTTRCGCGRSLRWAPRGWRRTGR